MKRIKLDKKGYGYRHCNLLENNDSEMNLYSYEEVMKDKNLTDRQKEILRIDRLYVRFYGFVKLKEEKCGRVYHSVGLYDIMEEERHLYE